MERATIVEVGEEDFEEQVLEASRRVPVVVDFWAGWCRPCLVLGPTLERLAEEYGGRFVLAKVDVDANPSLAAAFGIQGIPAVKAFRDGRVVDEFVGAQPEEMVRLFLKGIVPSEAEGTVKAAEAAEAAGDLEGAERAFRAALEADPEHERAAVGLARVLADRGAVEEARGLLGRFPGAPEARRLAARLALQDSAPAEDEVGALRARLASDPDDREAALAMAAADAAAGRFGDALERCLRLVADRGEHRERARDLMVRIFEVLGDDHPLTLEYRPRLASALF